MDAPARPMMMRAFRASLMAYGERVANKGVDNFTQDDAKIVSDAWQSAAASVMAHIVSVENAAHLWVAKAADGSYGQGGVPDILLDNPYALKFLETQGAELVVQIDEATRNTIREFVRRGMDEHLPTRETAKLLRAVLPLTQQQLAAVQHLVTSQLANGIPSERVADLAKKFCTQLVARRALAIAHTETIRASAAGLQSSWASALDRGLIGKDARQVWIGGGGARTCPICSALIGTEAPLGGSFSGISRPPAHTSCRCTLGLRIR